MGNVVYASLVLTILLIILLSVHGIRVQRNNSWLVGYLIVLGYSCWIGYLMESREIYKLPQLIRTGTVCGYLIVPMLYPYVRSTCYPGKVWQSWYILLFAPSIFFIIDLIPFWTLPASKKIEVFEISMRNLQSLRAFSEGWISPSGFHYIFRLLWSIAWFAAILVVIGRNRYWLLVSTNADNRSVYRFMLGLTLLSLPFLLIHSYIILLRPSSYTLSNFTFLLALPLIMASGYMLFFPKVVYGLNPPQSFIQIKEMEKAAVSSSDVMEEAPGLDQTQGNDLPEAYVPYITLLMEYMEKEKPYQQQGLTIHQLSNSSGIPTYIISMLVNRHFGQSFTNWLNGFRINQFKQMIMKPESRSFTLESLGREAGFSNRVTLIKTFKKQTGLTPGQFIRQQGGNQWSDLE